MNELKNDLEERTDKEAIAFQLVQQLSGHNASRPAQVNYDAAKVALKETSGVDYSVYYLG